MEAQSPTEFDPRDRKKILTALDIEGAEGVKDPYMVKRGSQYFMYFVYAKPISGISYEDMHRTGDVHNTGYAVAETGLAVSEDGINFRFIGTVLPVGISGWDQYQSRITTIIPYKGVNTVLWDGSFGVEQNFEEQASIAVSVDLITFAKIANGPVLETRMGKSIRYVDAIIHDNTIWYYYEYCTEGGAHELRLCRIPLGE